MELQHGDPSPAAGIAQRYHDGSAVQLTTPALQTNFSPTSAAFWQQVYLDMANLMAQAGVVPYLQFGEVQWWYFTWDQNPQTPHNSLPFYDAYTTSTFSATYGRPMHVFASSSEDPTQFPAESQFLPGLIGAFTTQIMNLSVRRRPYPVRGSLSSRHKRLAGRPGDESAAAVDCRDAGLLQDRELYLHQFAQYE
jgi:hypothetical protein